MAKDKAQDKQKARSILEAQDPRVFFSELLPDIIALRHDIFDRARGVLSITVQGSGSWTLRFGDHRSKNALKEHLDFAADLVVTFSSESFRRLLGGEPLDDKLSQIVWLGDKGLLELFGRLLVEPAKGGLAARLAQF